jgi:glycosyltransferase involved in cell wall biosynthesis
MVRDRDDVDVLVELDERNVNVARNAGAARARGEVVAFLSDELVVESGWLDAIREGFDGEFGAGATEHDTGDELTVTAAPADETAEVAAADGEGEAAADAEPDTEAAAEADAAADSDPVVGAVSGPTHRELRAGVTTEEEERRRIKGRDVTYLNPGNAAFSRDALAAIDGFDEYLTVGGTRDAAHRLAGLDYTVEWSTSMCARLEAEEHDDGLAVADGGRESVGWRWYYRSLTYRLVKNYGVRPTVGYRVARHAVRDAWETLRDVAGGEARPSSWLGNGRDVTIGSIHGSVDGVRARWGDRTPRRNANGLSSRADRAVAVFDRR